jgi:hypothetical protein
MSSITNEKNNIATEVQSLIDENKDNIPDGLYLSLCNAMKNLYKEEEKKDESTTGFYKVNYVYSGMVKEARNTYKMRVCRSRTEIITLKHEDADKMSRECVKYGSLINDEDGIYEKLSHYGDCDKLSVDITEEEEEDHGPKWIWLTGQMIIFKIKKITV